MSKPAVAYVLIITKHGSSQEVAQALLDFPEVTDLHELFGHYDLIVKIEADNNEGLGNFVRKSIIPIQDVESTETLVVSDILKDE